MFLGLLYYLCVKSLIPYEILNKFIFGASANV